jgi:hypothetical protein
MRAGAPAHFVSKISFEAAHPLISRNRMPGFQSRYFSVVKHDELGLPQVELYAANVFIEFITSESFSHYSLPPRHVTSLLRNSGQPLAVSD